MKLLKFIYITKKYFFSKLSTWLWVQEFPGLQKFEDTWYKDRKQEVIENLSEYFNSF